MQVAFLPFILKPVTDYSTVYTLLKNFNVLFQLEQEALPVFCDEGVYRIVVGIMLNKQTKWISKINTFLRGISHGQMHFTLFLKSNSRKWFRGRFD